MTQLWTPLPDGTYAKGTNLWVANPAGTFVQAKAGYVADSTGQYKMFWPSGASISSFTAVHGFVPVSEIDLAWQVNGAVKVQIRVVGSATLLYDGDPDYPVNDGSGFGLITLTNLSPDTNYHFTLRAIAADGTYVDSDPLLGHTLALPAPTNFLKLSGDYQRSAWAWNTVLGADRYELIDTLNGNAVKWSGTENSVVEGGLTQHTVYERAVRAKIGSSAYSVLSNKLRYTTPAAPTAAPGTYSFACTSAQTWSPVQPAWRAAADGIVVGNGKRFNDSYGDQVALAFFHAQPWIWGMSGMKVTRFKVAFKRDKTTGLSSPQPLYWYLHNYDSQPAGAPLLQGGPVAAGSLGAGESGLIDLPIAWGQALLNSSWKGIALGGAGRSYFRGDPVAKTPGQLTLYFTVA